MSRAKIIGLFVMPILASVLGCQTPVSNESIVGTWECTNLREMYPDPYFKNAYVIFGKDGVVTAYLENAEGRRMAVHKYRYHFDGTVEWEEEVPTTVRRVSILGDRMTTTIVKDSNPDNIGHTIEFRRISGAPIHSLLLTNSPVVAGLESPVSTNTPVNKNDGK